MSNDGGKRKRDDVDGKPHSNSSFKKKGKGTSNSRHANRFAVIKGPGIFVSCVRGRERKAAFELIDILEELVDHQDGEKEGINGSSSAKNEQETNTSKRNDDDDIESQIASELQEFKTPASAKDIQKGSKAKKFVPVFTDMECFFFIEVKPPFDPIQLTYDLLEDVKKTGIARSRFVHRLSPVSDTCFADLVDLTELIDRLVKQENFVAPAESSTDSSELTFKVDIKTRLNDKLSKSDIIQTLAKRMPTFARAKLDSPELVINVDVFRMTVGIAIVRHFDRFRKFNPIMLAEHQQTQGDANVSNPTLSRVANS
ncbi:uncharacterized protein FA14DRAFT_192280 [Meira miltonrushii]|uniref:THUMP domain-containing protein n=1 Tax=Meira miltonrushii TaxID=1280837 RepID=A0A316V382_9BASI|nr:uncharacterized protein FA14DRAFT_192280 [Meira miltonrushii]PWN32016.1 hypothetical protein FA14DRAFT_192280 [Meira miltonrushii]